MAEQQHISYKFGDWQNFRHIQIPAKDKEAGILLSDLKEEIRKDRNFNSPKFKITDFETQKEYQEEDEIKASTKVVVELVLEEELVEIDESVIFPSLGKEDNSPAVSVSSRESSVSASSRHSSASSRHSKSKASSKSGAPTTAGVSVATAPPPLSLDQEILRSLSREEEERKISEFVEDTAQDYESQVAYYLNQQAFCRKCRCYNRNDPNLHSVKDCKDKPHPDYVCELCHKNGDHFVENCYLPNGQVDKCIKCDRGTHVVFACPYS